MEDWIFKNAISLVSLAISMAIFVRTYLWPLKILVKNGGRIVITKDHDSHNLNYPFFLLDILFSNISQKRGFITDVGLIVTQDNKKFHFFAKYLIIDRKMNLDPKAEPFKFESFIGFEMKKEDSLPKRIGFVQTYDNDPFVYKPGKYKAEICIYALNPGKWKKRDQMEFEILPEDVNELNKMTRNPRGDGIFDVQMILRDKRTVEATRRIDQLKSET